ncbi:uncharacterized protein HD556DRAFT_1308476 [Suillus plorans]|uniref:Uncharacterized protein n=1 Tax=Suillus plorans TaxID=116603 RepID=A0A9P7APR3_9AGAM|nr:uncharacterized protein HD556DRAFT_1308476 [Suillus plorans]KAG1793615.1 hypothetical protein HD556DRAFT_1308476 [Suillus plorans]
MLSRDRRFALQTQVKWVFDAFSPFNSVSPLLSGRLFIEAPPIGTKEPPSLCQHTLVSPLKLTCSMLLLTTYVWPGHEVSLMQRAQLLRPSMFRNSAGTRIFLRRPIGTAAWAFNKDMQFCTTVASTKVWPIKYSGTYAGDEERVMDSSISGGATHRPGSITWSPNTRGPSDLALWSRDDLKLLTSLELPPAHTATILDPGVRCDSAADLPDPQYTLLFTPLGDKDTKITQSLTGILFVWLLPAKFKKELVLMGLVADGTERHIEKERIEADADLAANWWTLGTSSYVVPIQAE